MSYKLTHLSDLVVHSTERKADLDITVAAVVGWGLQLQTLKKRLHITFQCYICFKSNI